MAVPDPVSDTTSGLVAASALLLFTASSRAGDLEIFVGDASPSQLKAFGAVEGVGALRLRPVAGVISETIRRTRVAEAISQVTPAEVAAISPAPTPAAAISAVPASRPAGAISIVAVTLALK